MTVNSNQSGILKECYRYYRNDQILAIHLSIDHLTFIMYNVMYILAVIDMAKPVWSRRCTAVVALELYTVTPVRQLGVHTPLSRTKLSF